MFFYILITQKTWPPLPSGAVVIQTERWQTIKPFFLIQNRMKLCNICRKAQGDLAGKDRIVVGERGVCNICSRELMVLEEMYRQDFLERTEQRFDVVIPWPAFKTFTWPPNALILVSGWAVNRREFAVGISCDYIVAGRRSIKGIEKEMIERIEDLKKRKEEAKEEVDKRSIDREIEEWELRLKYLAKMKSQGERRLVSIPLERAVVRKVEKKDDWIVFEFDHLELVEKILGGEREEVKKEQWVVSAAYEDALKKLEERVKAQNS